VIVGRQRPLVAGLMRPRYRRFCLLFVLAGVAGAWQQAAARALVQAMPNGQRGLAFGLAQSGLLTAQGLGDPDRGSGRPLDQPAVVAIAGALGATVAAVPGAGS
jgi:hypothetical protein